MANTSTRASWLVYALGALCAAAIAGAILVVGPASGSQTTATRTAKAARGVVQSTVSGSGNLQAASQLNLGFSTGGTVTHIYVKQGQQVAQGQLLATLDPQSAEVTLEQAKAALQSAEANLAKEEETEGESSGSTGSAGGNATAVQSVATTTPSAQANTTPSAATPTATTPVSTTPTATTPTSTTPSTKAPSSSTPTTSPSTRKSTATKQEETTSESSSTSSSKATVSPATREANLASAKAAVKSDKLTVQSDEQAVLDTKLVAPEDGTIVSLSGQVGEVVSGSGTSRDSSSAATTSGSSTTTGASSSARSPASSASTASTSSTSSSAFAVLSDLSSMQLVVPLSESEIGNVKVGQIVTVTVEALEGKKLAAHVHEVATLSTSNSGVVSYDVTFQLDQLTGGIKPGMSATAEVVVKQAEGLSVPTSAISAGTVTVMRGGKQVRQRVVSGLAGNSSTIVLSGLEAGETVVLPTSTVSSSSTLSSGRRSALGGLSGGLGAGGLAGAGAGGPAGGGGGFFRGGG